MNVQNVLPRDAIPSIDQPAFGPDYFGAADDEVLVVDGDPPRAYPIRILSYHEIVNDRAIAVTWCPICWSAAVYDRRVNGQILTFGISGKLADDVLVMYDRETETEWQQSTGTAIAGELQGERLSLLESSRTTWAQFQTLYPDGEILQPPRETDSVGQTLQKHYDMTPYERYSESDEFGLYGMRGEGPRRSWERDDLDAKTAVLGLELGDDALGFPLTQVAAEDGLVTATVGGRDVVVVATSESVAAFLHPGFELERQGERLYGDGTGWDPGTGTSDDGRQLETQPTRRLFAFAWQDAHGRDSFYEI